jgi:hypothetical protein
MKFKTHTSDEGYVTIEIKVPFSVGPQTMAKFLKLAHKEHPFREPSQWKIRSLIWQLQWEVRYHGRTRIDKTEVKPEEEPLYFGWAERYFPELKR